MTGSVDALVVRPFLVVDPMTLAPGGVGNPVAFCWVLSPPNKFEASILLHGARFLGFVSPRHMMGCNNSAHRLNKVEREASKKERETEGDTGDLAQPSLATEPSASAGKL